MRIRLNEHISLNVPEGTTLHAFKESVKPDADIVIYNGFPVSDDRKLHEGDEVFLIQRGELPTRQELEHLMAARHTPGVHERLKGAVVGIAGVGGLGSNVAVALARVGIGTLVFADFDIIEPSNLNRQQFFINQIGKPKALALRDNLALVNPCVNVEAHAVMLDPVNIPPLFKGCSIVVEAFDKAEMKTMLINTVLERLPSVRVVASSGLAGYGSNNTIATRKITDRLYVVGDMVSEARPGSGLMAPRVSIAAGHQANMVVRLLLGEDVDDREG